MVCKALVKELREESVVVYFDQIGQRTISPHVFTAYSNKDNRNIAQWQQLPLCLSCAHTVHKSQSLEFSHVTVHCSGVVGRPMWEAGQISVAISRATSSTGLTVHQFRKLMWPSTETPCQCILWAFITFDAKKPFMLSTGT